MSDKLLLEIGAKAPDFILKDQNKNDVRLSDFKGKKVLLSFHPLAWTSVCAKQMKSLEENMEKFEKLHTIPLGINVDPLPSKKAWAEELGITNLRLLSDFWPHGEVAKLFGLFREQDGFSERANIIIDEEQKVIFFKIYDIPELPEIKEILTFLEK